MSVCKKCGKPIEEKYSAESLEGCPQEVVDIVSTTCPGCANSEEILIVLANILSMV